MVLFVHDVDAVTNMARVLDALRHITPKEQAIRHRELRLAWQHFVFRPGTTDASHSILREACAAAKQYAEERNTSTSNSVVLHERRPGRGQDQKPECPPGSLDLLSLRALNAKGSTAQDSISQLSRLQDERVS